MSTISEESLLKSLRLNIENDGVYKNYMSRLKTVKEVTKNDLVYSLKHPLTMYPMIKNDKRFTTVSSIANYLTAICKLFVVNETFSSQFKKEYEQWKSYLKENRIAEKEKYLQNEPTERQKKNYVSFKEVEAKLKELSNQSPFETLDKNLQFLLLTFLVNIRPKRADLGNLPILPRIPRIMGQKNFVLMGDKGTAKLYLNKYKTAYKYKTLIEPLNDTLTHVLRESIKAFPRDHVFGYLKSAKDENSFIPYEKNSTYSKFVQRTFKKLFGKDTGVSLWRHIYVIERLNPSQITGKEHLEAARLMGHSINQQRLMYQWVEAKIKDKDECETKCVLKKDEEICTTICKKKK